MADSKYLLFVAMAVVGVVMGLIGSFMQAMDTFTCPAEDEVPVEVIKDSFDMKNGDQLCIHIDNLKE